MKHVGKVYLVGAGPGDPDLLTVRALKLIERVYLILHDELVSAEILACAGPRARVVNVGKRCGAKKITQAEINEQMVDAARAGLEVVRLKSGDPAIFGRLAEEIDALEAAGIPFQIVPGVTAGLAAAASLQVSLTDRRKSSRVIVIANHQAHGGAAAAKKTDWTGLVRDDVTLVIYMPGQDFASLRAELIEAGMSADFPAVMVSRASTGAEKRKCTTLGDLDKLAPVESPSVLLIGRALDRARPSQDGYTAAAAFDEANLILSSL
jgi:uroporphyrin-III C-methyltransferase